MTYSVTRLGAYDALKQQLSNNGTHRFAVTRPSADDTGQRKLGMGEMLACASGAGVMGGIAGNPAGEPFCRLILQTSCLFGMSAMVQNQGDKLIL
jgi:dicarboxylate transporter 10